MSRRPLRIATTQQLEGSVRAAGFEVHRLPELPSLDFNRPLARRLEDGDIYRPFLQEHDIELVIDFNTSALTLARSAEHPDQVALTTATMGIPYVACYLDPIIATMAEVTWEDHWQLIESNSWIKGIPEVAHAAELKQLGAANILHVPMAAGDAPVNTEPVAEFDPGPVIAFMGHPASSWFNSQQSVLSGHLFAGLTAAAVRADMPDVAFHQIYYDLYEFDEPPRSSDDFATRAQKVRTYYDRKFVYSAYLAVKQRDRFARFLQNKLGDAFELVGDHWESVYGLKHTPRIWDMKKLHERMRRVPICLNLIKGNMETGLILRHFEITSQGGFMLTYPTAELEEFFEIGKECEVFHDEHELLEKIEYYLAHPKERQEIALAGQRRTLAEHRYSHRITKLVAMLREGGALPKIAADSPGESHRPAGEIRTSSKATGRDVATQMRRPPVEKRDELKVP